MALALLVGLVDVRFWALGLQEIASLVALGLALVKGRVVGRGECEFAVGFDSVVCKNGEQKSSYSGKASQDGQAGALALINFKSISPLA